MSRFTDNFDQPDYDPMWDADDLDCHDADDFDPSCDSDDVCEDQMSDVEADADTLASAGWGTDEDYGLYEGDSDLYGGGDDY